VGSATCLHTRTFALSLKLVPECGTGAPWQLAPHQCPRSNQRYGFPASAIPAFTFALRIWGARCAFAPASRARPDPSASFGKTRNTRLSFALCPRPLIHPSTVSHWRARSHFRFVGSVATVFIRTLNQFGNLGGNFQNLCPRGHGLNHPKLRNYPIAITPRPTDFRGQRTRSSKNFSSRANSRALPGPRDAGPHPASPLVVISTGANSDRSGCKCRLGRRCSWGGGGRGGADNDRLPRPFALCTEPSGSAFLSSWRWMTFRPVPAFQGPRRAPQRQDHLQLCGRRKCPVRPRASNPHHPLPISFCLISPCVFNHLLLTTHVALADSFS